jgi:pimeloyl-ACP methyl ester carboxylesterase
VIVRRSFDTEGRKVSYLTVDGARAPETMLLIHGAGVSARTWVSQLRGLADALRPIAIDLPGHRESDPIADPTLTAYAETAYRALEHLDTGPVFVAGHSLGGAVAQLLAARRPDMVKGLVLISTCAKVPSGDGGQRLLGFVPAPFRRAVFLWAVRKMLLAPSASPDAVDLTLDEIRGCRPETIQHDTAMGRAMDMERIAQGLRVRTLVLCGGRDRLTVPELSRQLGALIGGSQLEIVPYAGHMLPLEAPAVVNQAIRDFVSAVTRDGAVSGRLPASSRKDRWRRALERLVALIYR